MTKDDYIKYRNNKTPEPLWEYYNEKYTGENKLQEHEFMNFIMQWPGVNSAYQVAVEEFDARFNIMSVMNLNNREVIRYY